MADRQGIYDLLRAFPLGGIESSSTREMPGMQDLLDAIAPVADALLGRPEVREQYQFGEMPLDPWPGFKVIKGGKGAKDLAKMSLSEVRQFKQALEEAIIQRYRGRLKGGPKPLAAWSRGGAPPKNLDDFVEATGLMHQDLQRGDLGAKTLFADLKKLDARLTELLHQEQSDMIDMLSDLLGLQRGQRGALKGAQEKLKRRPTHFPDEREKARGELAKAFVSKEKNQELVLDMIEQLTGVSMKRPFSQEAADLYEIILRERGFGDLLE